MSESSPTLLRCGHCKEYKPTEAFYLNKASSRGYSYQCRDCRKALGYDMPKEKRPVPANKYHTRWSIEDDIRLLDEWSDKPAKQAKLANSLNRTIAACSARHYHLNNKPKKEEVWEPEPIAESIEFKAAPFITYDSLMDFMSHTLHNQEIMIQLLTKKHWWSRK